MKKAKKFLEDSEIDVLEWTVNSPELNPIENAWSYIKKCLNSMAKGATSLPKLHEAMKQILCAELDKKYFVDLAHSMPQRIQNVI